MSESKFFDPNDIMSLYNNQDGLNDTETYALKAASWARARLTNYQGYSDEIPSIELKDGIFYANTSKGRIRVPFNYDTLHDKFNIEERKVIKVDTPSSDMPMDFEQENASMQDMPTDNMQQLPSDVEVSDDTQFDSNFDAGVEADEETDPKRYIQQLAGKLSQSLRAYNSELPSPDIDLNKYVAGMINKQAIEGMNDKDVKDVLSKIKSDESSEDDFEEDNATDDDNSDIQNESIRRDKINEIFQDIINPEDKDVIQDKPLQNIGYKKRPFTSPNFEK